MTNKLEFVLNKIKEKCPELMELSFGCKLKDEVGIWIYCGTDSELERCMLKDSFGFETRNDVDDMEIIGHEPRLEHLLRAMKSVIAWTEIYVESNLEIISFANLETEEDNKFNYDLTKSVEDNLKSNEELLNFLYSLFNQEDL